MASWASSGAEGSQSAMAATSRASPSASRSLSMSGSSPPSAASASPIRSPVRRVMAESVADRRSDGLPPSKSPSRAAMSRATASRPRFRASPRIRCNRPAASARSPDLSASAMSRVAAPRPSRMPRSSDRSNASSPPQRIDAASRSKPSVLVGVAVPATGSGATVWAPSDATRSSLMQSRTSAAR